MPRQDHRLDNEAVLFAHVSRESLHAPAVATRFPEGPFPCQICEAGTGEPVTAEDWGGG